jgi:hypothetical protein
MVDILIGLAFGGISVTCVRIIYAAIKAKKIKVAVITSLVLIITTIVFVWSFSW